ncbi:MAG: hypothetical protein HXS40_04490 [Theionarchaea archaeon]|nr:hypothetical protein [Theionarchaea archaeon]
MMECRLSTPEDMEDITDILKKGHKFSSMTHMGWKLGDAILSPREYMVILEEEKKVTGTIFFESQSKQILGGTLTALTGGGGALYPEEDMPEKYSVMMSYVQGLAEQAGHPVITFAALSEFTYPLLKKMGFHQLFHQRSYVKILDVKKMIAIAMEKLNRAHVPDTITLVMRIRPESEDPFSIRLANGVFSLEEDTGDSDIEVAGDLRKVVASLTGNAHMNLVGALLKRRVTVRVRISSMVRVLQLILFLW